MLYFVRHAKAGSRHDWHDDDELRPLSRNGHRQAEALATRLAKRQPSVLLSSPYVRCIQTLQPLGEVLGVSVGVDGRLAENMSFEGALEVLAEVPDQAVLCSHGDLIPATIDALVRRGLDVRGHADFRKASVWVLERNQAGMFTQAKAWPPPE